MRRQSLAVVTAVFMFLQPVFFASSAFAQRRGLIAPALVPLGDVQPLISITTLPTTITQNFDTLPASGSATFTNDSTLPGWYTARTGTGTTIVANDGSSNTGNLYSYGTGTNTDRALGSVGSGGATAGSFFWGTLLTNNTGSTIASLDVSYTGEQWRNSAAAAQTVAFSYITGTTITGSLADFQAAGTNVTALDFTSPVTGGAAGALNGNLAANRVARSATISGVNLANGQSILLRWSDPDHTGSDHGLSIDDFSVTANGGVVQPTLSINDVSQAEGNAGTTVFTFTVSLSSPAGAGGVTFDIATQDGTATIADSDYQAKSLTGQTIPSGSSTYSFTVNVNGDTTTEANETFFVNVTNVTGATVSDSQGQGTIQNDDVTLTAIHDIQGSGSTSPLAGNVVTTTGIVTGVKSNGFFLQTPDANVDADPNTSEGIFVFTSSAPPAAAAIGNSVNVTGTVQEFVPSQDTHSPPTTELGSSPTVTQLSMGNLLPSPHVITAADTTAPSGTTNPLDTLEEFEGMRVSVPSLTVVAPTQGTINEPNATVVSNGVFYGVLPGVPRPFREPGINISDPLPPGSPANIPRFDENPEHIRVDSDAQTGATAIDVAAGTVISNVTGPLDFAFRAYQIDPDAATPPTVGTQPGSVPVPTPRADELTVASFNMERFFDTVDDPSTSDPVLTPTAFNNRLSKASLIIRTVQHSPDVIGVEEMENLSTLQAVADKVNTDAGTPGDYQAYLVEGNDIGGIDVGFLVKSSRVNVVDVTQFGKTTTYINPNNNTAELLNDRPPLVLRATARRPGETTGPGTFAFTVIVNHLRSLSGVDDPVDGNRVRTKRRAQAEFLANLIQSRQSADPTERIISVGDYNAFQINDGYVDSIGTIKGTPAPADQVVLSSSDLVNPDLTDLVDTLTPDQRYSFSFDGNAQVLDHIIVNQPALAIVDRFAYARDDADFPVKNYEDPAKDTRLSDHDQPVAYLALGAPQPQGSVIISEFRLRGPGATPTQQANNEFIEFYNNTDSNITVATTDGSAGWALVASDGIPRFTILNGTVIPARGHYLGVNSVGYSLATYPAGNGTTATGDSTYTTDIPDNAGIALFNTSNPANFTLGNRLDAVGSTSEANALYKEGTGYPPLSGAFYTSGIDYSFYRDTCGKGGSITTFGPCPSGGLPVDTNNNATDFIFVDPNGTSAGAGQRLGAPGPENLSSPIQRNATIAASFVDPGCTGSTITPGNACGRFRDTTSDPPNNSTFGTLSIRRKFTNNTGAPVTQLRFRVVDVTTFPAPSGIADLRSRTSSTFTASLSGGGTTSIQGLTLETPPNQPNGGGFNTSLSAGTITLLTPLAAGASINVHFLLGVEQTGSFKFFVNLEALP